MVVCLSLLVLPTLAAAATWIPPVDLGTSSEVSAWEPRPEIALSGVAGGVAIWPQEKGAGSLESASMNLTGTWGPPVTLAPAYWGQREDPQLAMNEAGEAVAVWKHFGEQASIVARVRTPLGSWGPRETLSPEGSPDGLPDVAVGPEGEAVAVWCQAPRYGPYSAYRIETSFRPPGGHWEPAVVLSDPEDASYSPQVAIAPTGKILAAWYGFYGDNSKMTVQVAETESSQWGEPQEVSADTSAWWPEVAAGTAGATVVWQTDEGIEAASQASNDGWQPPVELSGPESTEPEIGADAAGNAVVIWNSVSESGHGYIEGSTHAVGGQWSEPTEIAGPVFSGEGRLRLAVSASGRTLAAWSVWRKLGPDSEGRYIEEASGVGGGWEEPTTLSATGAWAVFPAVALDDQGDGAVAWWSGNRHLPQATEFVVPRATAPAGGDESHPSGGPSGPERKGGRAKAGHIALVRKGKAYVKVRCPGSSTCKGRLRLVVLPTRTRGKPIRITSAPADFTIPAGRKEIIKLRLDKKGRSLVSAAGQRGIHAWLRGSHVQPLRLLLKPAGDA